MIEKHHTYLLGIARSKFARFPLDPEDAVQRTFVRFLETNQYAGKSSLRSYLYRIMCNEFLMDLRARRRREARERAWDEDFQCTAYVADTDEEAQEVARLDDLRNAMELLSALDREILQLQYGGASVREIAATVGLRCGAVKTRAHRARRTLLGMLSVTDVDAAASELQTDGENT